MTEEVPFQEFEVAATAEQLSTVAELANTQISLENAIEVKETELKDLRTHLAKIQQGLLPDALFAAGLSEFKTLKGDKVIIKEDISLSVPKDKKESICAWLEREGHEDVITGKVYVEMPKNSHNERQAAIQALTDAGLEPVEDVTVNTATLKSILRQHLKKGDSIDLAEFGAFAWKKSEIKRA